MDAKKEGTPSAAPEPMVIPDDAIVVRQSHWTWIWATVPWMLFFAITLFFDFLTFGIFPIVLSCIVIIPRYMSFRKTAYALTEEYLMLKQGSLMGQHRTDVPLADVKGIEIQPGRFGSSLGYTGIHLLLNDGRMVYLHYIPVESPFVIRFQTLKNSGSFHETTSGD